MLQKLKRVCLWGDVAFFVAFAAFILTRASLTPRTILGFLIAALGFALWVSSRLQLGEAFSLGARARTLVTTGWYSHIRHPIYLFGFFAYLGIFLIWGKWFVLAGFIVLYSIEIFRLRKEEKALEETFGDEYRSYKARTWF